MSLGRAAFETACCSIEDLNFLLTNRIPRIALTRFMGWFSQIRTAVVRDLSIAAWKLFAELDLSDAKKQTFTSLHDCFTRELREGARAVDADPGVLCSPSDGIVGACGPGWRTAWCFRPRASRIRLHELFGDSELGPPTGMAATSRCA
jgi:phosphatidylserine decarboxylase